MEHPKINTILFDDDKFNVHAAQKSGLQAYCVEGIDALKEKLKRLEIL